MLRKLLVASEHMPELRLKQNRVQGYFSDTLDFNPLNSSKFGGLEMNILEVPSAPRP